MNTKWLLITLITVSFFLRIWRIDYPNTPIWDEVYYTDTAKQYLQNNQNLWNYNTKPPAGHFYVWEHPPLASEMMALFMKLFNNTDVFIIRLPSVLLGTLSIYLVYLLGNILFKNKDLSLISAALFSIDGLNFVQSRTAMLDIYLVTFILLSLIFFLKQRFYLSALFLGLALGSKWTAVYLVVIFLILLYTQKRLSKIVPFLLVVPLIYLALYIPFFLSGHNLGDFINLVYQQGSYHLQIKATNNYASAWWSWPLSIQPVWYFTEFKQNIAIIFASGTTLFWAGTGSIFLSLYESIKRKNLSLFILTICFFLFWLPWALSPRIMFLYYFAPAVPFLSLSLAYQIHKLWKTQTYRFGIKLVLALFIINFIIFYPFLTALPLPKEIVQLIFRTNLP